MSRDAPPSAPIRRRPAGPAVRSGPDRQPWGDQPPDWPDLDGCDDVTPVIADMSRAGTPFALATLVAAEGGPRAAGTQMVVTAARWWGYLSGGCVEAEVARQGRAALADGRARRLVYGRGSPFFDIRLPCGGRLDTLVEPVAAGDPAMQALATAFRDREAVRYQSDGTRRRVVVTGDRAGAGASAEAWPVDLLVEPAQRLVVVGSDPFALAIAAAGRIQGWDVALVRPGGPPTPPPLDVAYLTEAPDAALARLAPDAWTAVAIATHESDADHAALVAALRSGAGYVGAMGSRHRLAERLARLAADGMGAEAEARLHAPIGLDVGPRPSPRALAVGVVAQIHAARTARTAGAGAGSPWPSEGRVEAHATDAPQARAPDVDVRGGPARWSDHDRATGRTTGRAASDAA